MAIRTTRDFAELYRITATEQRLHALSGRGDREDLTRFTNDWIRRHVPVGPEDVVVDVGCGDGSLLRSLSGAIRAGIGIVPTEEERDALRRAHASAPDLEFRVGRADALPLEDGVATRVVCNGVLLLVGDVDAGERAFAELARILGPGGLLWLGEHPEVDEFDSRALYGGSIRKRVRILLRPGGVRATLSVAWELLRARLGRGDVVVPPQSIYFSDRRQVESLGRRLGLSLQWTERHPLRSADGRPATSPTRRDYLFARA